MCLEQYRRSTSFFFLLLFLGNKFLVWSFPFRRKILHGHGFIFDAPQLFFELWKSLPRVLTHWFASIEVQNTFPYIFFSLCRWAEVFHFDFLARPFQPIFLRISTHCITWQKCFFPVSVFFFVCSIINIIDDVPNAGGSGGYTFLLMVHMIFMALNISRKCNTHTKRNTNTKRKLAPSKWILFNSV